MTTIVATFAGLLGVDDQSRRDAAQTLLTRSGKLAARRLVGPLRQAAAASVIDASIGFLQSPLAEVLGDAWQKSGELAKFKDPRKHPPEEINEYPLAGHDIAVKRKPTFDITLDGAPTGLSVESELKLALELKGVVLRIQGGHIIGARVGDFLGSGAYSIETVKFAERKTSPFRLPGDLTFARPVAL